jgi:thymidylate synthase ThyX
MENKPNFSEEDMEILKRHVSNIDSNIYVIYNLPPEVVAVLFAYVSRSPLSFRENLLKLIKGKDLDLSGLIGAYADSGIDYSEAKRKAKEFHERWVVGYGHSSIAEHAVASIAIENVSILATKIIEDNRLASFTEKSTRYQIFDRNRYYKPGKLMASPLGKIYEETCNNLFDVYAEITPKMIEFMKSKYPKTSDMSDALYEGLSKARSCDVVRYILPTSTLTNLAMTANARTLEHAIRKMLSQPVEEMTEIGQKIRNEVTKIIPTLVKHVDSNPYISETEKSMEVLSSQVLQNVSGINGMKKIDAVTLVDYDKNAENKLVSAILYRYSNKSYKKIMAQVKKMGRPEKEKIVDEFLKRMGKFDRPLRELEHINYTFDILIDYGAFRDIQRHRICTQTNQELTTDYGYSTPEEIVEAGFKDQFDFCMKRAEEAYKQISKEFPKEAQYVLPLAYRKRTLFTWNLRELYHFISLRSRKEGHMSYRIIAQKIYEELNKVHPLLAKYITVEKI